MWKYIIFSYLLWNFYLINLKELDSSPVIRNDHHKKLYLIKIFQNFSRLVTVHHRNLGSTRRVLTRKHNNKPNHLYQNVPHNS